MGIINNDYHSTTLRHGQIFADHVNISPGAGIVLLRPSQALAYYATKVVARYSSNRFPMVFFGYKGILQI